MFTKRQWMILILAVMLMVFQVYLIVELNGDLHDLIVNKELDVLALLLSPMAGVVYLLHKLTDRETDTD